MEDSGDDIDTSNWVLVDEVDAAEEAILLNQNSSDSDLDSDGSISIISEYPTESHSEEEEQPFISNASSSVVTVANEHIAELTTKKLENQDVMNDNAIEELKDDGASCASISDSDDASLSIISETDKNWMCVDTKTPLETKTDLDGPEETSADNDTDLELNNSDVQNLPVVIRPPNEQQNNNHNVPQKLTINIHNNGILIGVIILLASIIIRQYLTNSKQYDFDTEKFEEPRPGNHHIEEALKFCIQKHISTSLNKKTVKVDKCVEKRIRKIHKADMMKNTEAYLQLKEKWFNVAKNLDTEQTLMTKKQLKRNGNKNLDKAEKIKKQKGNKEKYHHKPKKYHKNISPLEEETVRRFKEEKYDKTKGKRKSDWEKYKNIHGKRLNLDKNDDTKLIKSGDYEKSNKQQKHYHKNILKNIKKTIKEKFGKLENRKIKNKKSHKKITSGEEEWYIKYNPVKDTLELINISKSEDRHFILLDNSNQTVNGQWYINLNSARSQFRNKEKTADWYFNRVMYRDNKRNKAKWYFDYMTSREENRYQIY